MKLNEIAFVNQQLAGMLKAGIPLEGALKKLCAEMQRGWLKNELHQLEADLGKGTPLMEALAARKFPEFYVKMIQVGVASNNLPGVLIMLADYYQRVHSIWTRLKGLMVYPMIVLLVFFGLSLGISIFYRTVAMEGVRELLGGRPFPEMFHLCRWLPWLPLAGLIAMALLMAVIPETRRSLCWRLPAFHEASLSRMAAAMGLMLQGGCSLKDTIDLMLAMEKGTPVECELTRWQALHAGGCGSLLQIAIPGRVISPLFCWLINSAGETPVTGLKHAADLYAARAVFRIEVMLYAGLPMTIILLGMMILIQVYSFFSPLIAIITTLEGGGN